MIVSDSTALITLINIDEFELLHFFEQKIILPKEVYDEVVVVEQAEIFLDAQIKENIV